MEWQETLRRLRKEKGFSQAELAEELGISRQAVSRWEKGLAVPSAENLIGLSRLYEMPVEELYQKGVEQRAEVTAGEPEELTTPKETAESTQPEQPGEKQSRRKTWLVILAVFTAGLCLVLIVLGKIMHAEAATKIFLIFVGFLALSGWLIAGMIKKIVYKLRKDCK